ncbi:MAG: gamma-glutamyl-gamma-aminobutyrate hydrolase family protein [Bacteriovoracia bacterium]
MIKKIVFLLFAFTLSFSSWSCELPKGETINIGCSYDCSFFYRFRLIMTAWGMGYSAKITTLHDQPDMKRAMSEVDAILLPGGADIDPRFYLDEVTPELREYTLSNLNLVKYSNEGRERDPFEYALVKTYSEDESFKNVPMLGICRGLQMMSVAQGIPLYLDIKTELGIKNRYNRFDRVSLLNGMDSLIKELYQRKSFKGFKLHHQGIRVPYYEKNQSQYPLTRVTAFSNNRKIAEAIEYTHRPALGVQYHPERSFSGTSVPVFKWLLTKACEYKKSARKE